jgi:hypothetical protein
MREKGAESTSSPPNKAVLVPESRSATVT